VTGFAVPAGKSTGRCFYRHRSISRRCFHPFPDALAINGRMQRDGLAAGHFAIDERTGRLEAFAVGLSHGAGHYSKALAVTEFNTR
jgi:hypothetical protein